MSIHKNTHVELFFTRRLLSQKIADDKQKAIDVFKFLVECKACTYTTNMHTTNIHTTNIHTTNIHEHTHYKQHTTNIYATDMHTTNIHTTSHTLAARTHIRAFIHLHTFTPAHTRTHSCAQVYTHIFKRKA